MQCKSEMEDHVDIEENNIFGNSLPRNIITDISKIKQELEEDVQPFVIETQYLLLPKQERVEEVMNPNQSPTTTAAGLPNTSKYIDDNIPKNVKGLSGIHKTTNQNVNVQLGLEKSSKVLDVCKEEQFINYSQEFDLILKKEIPTCNVCSKESEEEMCKQCVLESAEGPVQCSPLDSSVLQVVDNTKKEPGITFACDICSYTSFEKSDLVQHLLKHTEDISPKYGYKTSRNVTHKKRIHSTKSKHNALFCDICEYECISKSHLIGHLRKHTGEKPFKCNLCDYASSQAGTLKSHIRAKHTNEKNYSCTMCEFKSVTKSHLIRHLRTHTGKKPYKCNLCDYECADRSQVKYHVKAKHTNEKNYSCKICEYKSVTKGHLIQHLRKHTGDKPYKCDLCDLMCSRSSHLKNHMRAKHTNEKNYSCNTCEYKSVTKSHLIQHLRTHTGEKPYKCNLCDHMCARSSHLKTHMRAKHTNEKNYSCNLCEYKAVTKSHLMRHLRKHTGEKPFKCDLCDYTSSRVCYIKMHIKAKHTNEKNYSCNICEYKSLTKICLNQHLRTHTGEKPYKCDLCDYTCARKSNLKNHMKAKHTNEKKYSCELCEYKSVTNTGLKRHNRKHTGEKPYKCDLCDYASTYSGNVKYHKKTKHTNENK